MKVIIGLDLSTKCSGYSCFALNGELLAKEKITPKTTMTTYEKIHFVAEEIYRLFIRFRTQTKIKIERVIIEDIYLGNFKGKNQVKGFATLARLSGAVSILIAFAERKLIEDVITFRPAVQARPIVGLKGTCKKAEVQLWVLKNFNVLDPEIADKKDEFIEIYEGLIEAVQAEKEYMGYMASEESDKELKKEIRKKANDKYKKEMEKISKLIEKETDHGEDVCDAILLGFGECMLGLQREKDAGLDPNRQKTIDVENVSTENNEAVKGNDDDEKTNTDNDAVFDDSNNNKDMPKTE